MKETDNDLEFKHSLADKLVNNVKNEMKNQIDLNEELVFYRDNGEYTNNFYNSLERVVNSEYRKMFDTFINEETFIKKIGNSNGNDLREGYFKITQYDIASRPRVITSPNGDNTDIDYVLHATSGAVILRARYLSYDPKTKVFINGTSRRTNTVNIRDMGIFEYDDVSYVRIESLVKKIRQFNELLENKAKELNEIKDSLSKISYINSFMKDNELNNILMSDLKTKMILNTLTEGEKDEAIDIETNINEIINITI